MMVKDRKWILKVSRALKALLTFRTLCLAPAILYLLLLFGYPAFYNIKLGFEQEDGAQFILHSPVFNGLANYRQLVHDPVFLHALANTAIFGVVTVSLQVVIGFGIAMLLNKTSPFYTVVRSALLVPWLLPLIVSGNVWIWMLDGFYGVLNYILLHLHLISHYTAWLSSPKLALGGVIVANTWLGIPFNVMIIYAGLRAIPDSLYRSRGHRRRWKLPPHNGDHDSLAQGRCRIARAPWSCVFAEALRRRLGHDPRRSCERHSSTGYPGIPRHIHGE